MSDSGSIESVWWLPEHGADQHVGSLRLESDPAILHLVMDQSKSLDERVPVLHGVGGQRLMTLRGLQRIGGRVEMPGFETTDFLVPAAFIGAHVTDFTITRAEFSFEYLSPWSGVSGVVLEAMPDEPEGSTSMRYQPPDTRSAALPMGNLTLSEKLLDRSTQAGQRLLEPTASFTMRLTQPQHLDNVLHSVVRPLQSFLTLATGRANAQTWLRVQHAASSLVDAADARPAIDPDAEWFEEIEEMRRDSSRVMLPVIPRPGSNLRAFQSDEMTFSLHDIVPSFEAILQRWFIAVEELRAATDLYFANQYRPAPSLEIRFLQHCQAAETIHRARYANDPMPSDVFAQRSGAILGLIVDEEARDWVRRALEESNTKRLRTRYSELIADAPLVVRRVVGDADAFAADLVNSRNWYTHYGRGQDKALRGAALHRLNVKLRLLIHSRLIRELGFSDAVVETGLARTRMVREIEYLNGQHL